MALLRPFAVATTLGLIFASAAFAQLPPNSSTTATPIPGAGHDYLNGSGETVNPATGSVSIRIPVVIPPGRGATLPFSFAYDSSGVNFISGNKTYQMGWFNTTSIISQGGWSNTVPLMSGAALTWTTLVDGGPTQITCKATINYVFQDAHGVRHSLGLTTYFDPNFTSQCSVNQADWPPGFDGQIVTTGGEGSLSATTSNSNTNLSSGVTVVSADGATFAFGSHTLNPWLAGSPASTWKAGSVADRNGNTITIGGTLPAFNYTDTLGRTVLQDSGFAVSPETLTVSGLGAPYTLTWTTLPTPSFTTPITTPVITGVGTVACGNPPHVSWGTNNHVVSSVALPNGKSFSFTYDTTYGLVNKITYPTGGYVRYVWGMNANAEYGQYPAGANFCNMYYGVPAITDRYVSFNGTTEVLHQHFVYSTTWGTNPASQWTSKQTTVTTYDLIRNNNFQTVYIYYPVQAAIQPNMDSGLPGQIPVEHSVAVYDFNGALLKTTNKGWRNERLLTSEQTTFANGQTNQTTYNYDSNEMQIERDDYDFGNNAPGNFLRATVTNYAATTAMVGAHVVDKPSNVIVYSNSAKTIRVAETDYGYDSPAATATSGVVSHSPGCNCGNLTQQSQWLNTTGITLNTTFTNDDTGQRLSMTDPRGFTTNYSYADSFSSGTPPGPTNAYLTQVTHPQTNGVNHIEKYSYAYASGLVTSSTDQNNLVTSYKYVDNLARLTETDFPDGGKTLVAYNDSAYNPSTPSPSVTTTKAINSTTNLITISAFDGLGHAIRSETSSDPQGTVYVDTAYDGLGRISSVSNPYRSGTDPTTSSGTIGYSYDSLGRKTSVTYPDNSVLTTAYCAGSTLVTDPTGKWRRSRVDGLGRLVEVDEPNAPGAAVASSGCPGTGEPVWVTSYTVDTLGNLISVLQNGSHARSFTYDSLSRLLCASNPENSFANCPASASSAYTPGTTGYTYDLDSNLAAKTVSTSHLAATSGSGSATLNGAEQSIAGAPGVAGSGSVTFAGALQSKQVISQPATHGTGSVSIVGSEQSGNFCDDSGRNCHFKYDLGTVTINVNSHPDSISYGRYDTSSTVASNLAAQINSDSAASVTATASGSTVNLTSKSTGAITNYTLSASSVTNDPTDFGSGSFAAIPSGSTLTGGHDNVYTTLYDSGTSTITVNAHANAVSWSGSSTTTSTIASALASAINADSGASVTASASGATVNLTAKTIGASTNYSLSSSSTFDSADFSSGSFSSSNSGATLTGGRDPGATVYDSGSVWVSINGTQYSVSYGQGSSSSSLAGTLASAISAGSLANATANGSGVSITAKSTGAATNYSLSSGSSTSQPGSFSSPSFTVSVSGPTLTGGTDPDSPVVTSYSYDSLNRPLTRSYSNGDPTVSITYDQSNCVGLAACQNIGHRTSMTDAAGSESWAYQTDSGNFRSIHADQRTTSGITKTATYYLDLAGNVTQAVYPTGRTVNYTYDAANRPKTAADASNGITYATGFQTPPSGCLTGAVCYTPQGALYALSIGQASGFTGLNLTHTYNNRLQPSEFKAATSAGNAIDISYGFVDPVSAHNAGHVYAITNNLDATRSQTFTYDQLNRITSALTTSTHATSPAHCWGETYSLDPWGNLNGISPTTNSNYTGCSVESGFATTADGNNHLPNFSYDPMGNTQSDSSITYTWDAESQLKSAINSGATTNYSYDGDGRRVAKVGSKLYWYGAGGDILAETDASGTVQSEYVFFAGQRIAMVRAGSTPLYYVEDMLGTSRLITGNTGLVCYDADFYPYGGERAYTNSCSQNYKFEGKERDSETGNDAFGARYYSNRFGRWLSSDWSSVPAPIPYANLTNPQTLNLYSMVADDPESFADLDGHVANVSQGTTAPGEGGDGPSCAASGQGASGSPAVNGCKKDQPAEQTQAEQMSTVDKVKTALDVVGLVPAIGDVANAGSAVISLAQGHYGEAALSALAAVPLVGIVGEVGKGAKLAKEAEEAVSVYKKTETAYVGISKNLAQRELRHGEKLTEVVGGLTRTQARGVEQAVIEQKGMLKNGGILTNKINSIAKTNPIYKQAVEFGRQILKSISF